MSSQPNPIAPFSGFGLGLRRTHYEDFLGADVPVDFVEVISENYMIEGGRQMRILEEVRAKLPVIIHGVSMSIGSARGLDEVYLSKLKQLEQRIDPLWVSDHLCWTRTSAHNSHDLLPMPLTQEALQAVCNNIDHAQSVLGRAMLFEVSVAADSSAALDGPSLHFESNFGKPLFGHVFDYFSKA